MSTRKRIATIATAAIGAPGLVTAAQACPNGVWGVAQPGATVCIQDLSTGLTYCDVADASGVFNIYGSVVPPSTANGCLPTSGQFWVYDNACYADGKNLNRNVAAQQYGGWWLDVRCGLVVVSGLPNLPIGFVDINPAAGGGIVVSGIGPSGTDGVLIDLGSAQSFEVESSTLLDAPIGASVSIDADGAVDGQPGMPVGSLTLARTGAESWNTQADFGAIGSPAFAYQVYNQGQYAGSIVSPDGMEADHAPLKVGGGGDPEPQLADGDCGCGFIGDPKNKIGWPVIWKYQPNGPYVVGCPRPPGNPPPEFHACAPSWWFVIAYDGPTQFSPASGGGDPITGDTIIVTLLDSAPVSFPVSTVALYADGMSSLTIADEGLGLFNSVHRGAGDAMITALDDGTGQAALAVATLGSAGNDGLSMELDLATQVDVDSAGLFEAFASAPTGSYAVVDATAQVSGVPDVPAGRLWFIQSEGGKVLAADFSELPNSAQRIVVMNQGLIVGMIAPYEGVIITSEWPITIGKLGDIDADKCFTSTYPAGTLFQIADQTYEGDELRILAIGGSPSGFEGLTRLDFRASGIFGFDVSSVSASPPEGCDEDLDGDGVIGLGDLSALLTDFGSSGAGLTGDIDRDGDVDLADLSAVLSVYGSSCP